MSGFIRLERTAFDHHLIGSDRHFRPWFWMVSMACWKPTKYDIGGKTVTLERGQLCASIRQMADAWGWSKSAVERFLTRLETETMIERNPGHGKMVLTILNYSKYQDAPEGKRDSSGTASGTAAGQQRDIKEQGNKLTSILLSEDNRPRAVDLVKAVFDSGVPILMADGATEKQARSLLGKLRADHGDPAVLDALARCEVERPSELRSWLVAHCGGKRKGNGYGKSGTSLAGPAQRALAAIEKRDYG